jgi:hypothetical protein
MEQDLWDFGHVNENYDGTGWAGYSTDDCVSPTRSIRLMLSGGGTVGLDGDAVYATRTFTGSLKEDARLQLEYNVAQQTDGDGWGGMHGSADVVVLAYDADGVLLGSYTYRLACSDLHESAGWYAHMGGDAGSPCHQTGAITYIGTPDEGGEYEPGPGWQTLDVCPGQDLAVDWTAVASIEIRLVVSSCFMHLDTFEVFFDDLDLDITVPATVDIDPDTLNLGSQGQWVTAYIGLPEGFDPADIDISTVALEGLPAVRGEVQGDVLMVKFNRAELEENLKDRGLTLPADVTLQVTGAVGGVAFEGSDTIRVMAPPKKAAPPAPPKAAGRAK